MAFATGNDNLMGILMQITHLNMQTAKKMFIQYDVKPGQAGILFILDKHGRLSQKEVADRFGVTPPSITVALRKMESQNYIYKEPDENDRRIIRLSLTDKGKECVEHIKHVAEDLEKTLCKDMSIEEKLLLRRLFIQMRDNLLEGCDETMICPPLD